MHLYFSNIHGTVCFMFLAFVFQQYMCHYVFYFPCFVFQQYTWYCVFYVPCIGISAIYVALCVLVVCAGIWVALRKLGLLTEENYKKVKAKVVSSETLVQAVSQITYLCQTFIYFIINKLSVSLLSAYFISWCIYTKFRFDKRNTRKAKIY